jgi:penicillin-binding protein 1B
MVRSGLFLGNTKTISRKVKEIAVRAAHRGALRQAHDPGGLPQPGVPGPAGQQEIHGVAAGAEFWFGRDLRDLSTEEVALLVGIIQGPSASTIRAASRARAERRNFALAKMHETGLINDGGGRARQGRRSA